MRKFFVAAIPGGYAVAYHHNTLGRVIEGEYLCRAAAERQADRREAQHQADMARATHARFRQQVQAPRRPVRWFPPDVFA